MGPFALNAGVLNGGAGVPRIAGAADVIPAAASVSASAYVRVAMQASVLCAASVNANANVNANAAVAIAGAAEFSATAYVRQAASAQIVGSADLIGYTLRKIAASADVLCTASFVAIPASTLAQANVGGMALLAATATKMQSGAANAAATSDVTAAPRVIRNVQAAVLGVATLRVEAKQNQLVDGFAAILGTADITLPNSGIVLRLAGTDIGGQADVQATATRTHSAAANVVATSFVLSDAVIYKNAGAVFSVATAGVVAEATRIAMPQANVLATADLAAPARIRHAASAQVDATTNLSASGQRITAASAALVCSADTTAEGVCLKMAQAIFDCKATVTADAMTNFASTGNFMVATASVVASATVLHMAAAQISGEVAVVVTSKVERPAAAIISCGINFSAKARQQWYGEAFFNGTAEISPITLVKRMVSANILGTADVTPAASATNHHFGAADIVAFCGVTANASTNVMALDPPERTMHRVFIDRTMTRPFINREMRRTA